MLLMKLKLAEIRKKKRFTQEALAEASGVSRATIARMEGKRYAEQWQSSTLYCISAALGVEVRELFGYSYKPDDIGPEGERVISAFMGIPAEHRAQAASVIDSVAAGFLDRSEGK